MTMNETLMWKEINESAAGCRAAKAKNTNAITELVRAVKKKKVSGVVIAARGTSDHAGVFAKYLIETYCGVPVSLAAPSVYTVYEGALCLKNQLVIGLSQSGRAADAVEVLSRARACGAVTAAITNEPESPMVSCAEFHLDCSMGPEKSVAATKTFIGELYLILSLVAKWSGNALLRNELKHIPQVIEKTYKQAEMIEQAAGRYRFIQDSFVLGRGFAYPIALEFALKTQETCYIRSRGYATSDFYHGPVAQVSDGTPVFQFALGEKLTEDSVKMIDRLHQAGGDVFVFTQDAAVLAKADSGVLLPECDEICAIFAASAAMQMFACALSTLRGLNPDNPRGLSKVTITK